MLNGMSEPEREYHFKVVMALIKEEIAARGRCGGGGGGRQIRHKESSEEFERF